MEKNGIYEGTVVGLGTDGEGIINGEGATVFVPFCLVGEKIRYKVLKIKGGVAYGRAEEILTPSPDRAKPVCPVFTRCGGCGLQHMKYSAQLKFKRENVARALQKIGGITFPVSETVAWASGYGYRNKLALPIGTDGAGNTVVGFYAPHSHRIVPVSDCAIHPNWAKDVINAVNEFAAKGNKGYDEGTGGGVLRHIVARKIGGKFIFALVAAKKIDVGFLVGALEKKFDGFTFLLNINREPVNVIFGKEWITVKGDGFYSAKESGIEYRAGADTFIQVNDDIREKLYKSALDEAEEGAVALDLYSGGGLLTAMLAKKCGAAYGIEVVKQASECADRLKEKNGLREKMFNVCGKVEEKISEILKKTAGKKRIIVCDPPRKGMGRGVVNAIAASDAEKIILISCNPATLARDLGLISGTLTEKDGNLVKTDSPRSAYEINKIVPFDMFPQTKWAETLVVLSKKR